MNLPARTGITVAECLQAGQPIQPSPAARAAFIGRAHCGPLNKAITVSSIAKFRKLFGGGDLALSRAVGQFFAQGGQSLIVVRVANAAKTATLKIPAGRGHLTLRALHPGRHESLRAAIDYDGLPAGDPRTFNLTLQRLAGESSRIVDQEFYSSVSIDPESPDSIADALGDSEIAALVGDLPASAPSLSRDLSYAGVAEAGDDGDVLTDYDLIGCEESGTGLFALDSAKQIDFIYAPELDDLRNRGVLFQAAALKYVEKRHALMVVDPPELGQRSLLAPESTNLLTYDARPFRRQQNSQSVPVGGALIGMLVNAELSGHRGAGTEQIEGSLGRGLRLQASADSTHLARRRQRTNRLQLLQRIDGRHIFVEPAPGGSLARCRARIILRRSILEATRWLVFAEPGQRVWQDIEQQVGSYLRELSEAGVLAPDTKDLPYFVRCDSLTNSGCDSAARETRFLFGYCLAGETDLDVYSVSQSLRGASVSTAAFCPVFKRPA